MFFLSDVEILHILAETKSTNVIHTHLEKIFIGVQDLCYENNQVVALQGPDGETITFEQTLQVEKYFGCVEKLLFDVSWLNVINHFIILSRIGMGRFFYDSCQFYRVLAKNPIPKIVDNFSYLLL